MRRVAVAWSFLCISGCSLFAPVVTPVHPLDAEAIGPLLLDVCDQHDESVERDPGLTVPEKEQALLSTVIVRRAVGAALGREVPK